RVKSFVGIISYPSSKILKDALNFFNSFVTATIRSVSLTRNSSASLIVLLPFKNSPRTVKIGISSMSLGISVSLIINGFRLFLYFTRISPYGSPSLFLTVTVILASIILKIVIIPFLVSFNDTFLIVISLPGIITASTIKIQQLKCLQVLYLLGNLNNLFFLL